MHMKIRSNAATLILTIPKQHEAPIPHERNEGDVTLQMTSELLGHTLERGSYKMVSADHENSSSKERGLQHPILVAEHFSN